jgi:hypothetical protein
MQQLPKARQAGQKHVLPTLPDTEPEVSELSQLFQDWDEQFWPTDLQMAQRCHRGEPVKKGPHVVEEVDMQAGEPC